MEGAEAEVATTTTILLHRILREHRQSRSHMDLHARAAHVHPAADSKTNPGNQDSGQELPLELPQAMLPETMLVVKTGMTREQELRIGLVEPTPRLLMIDHRPEITMAAVGEEARALQGHRIATRALVSVARDGVDLYRA